MRDHTAFLYTVLGWAVPDIQDALADLSANGVSFERSNLLSLTEFGDGKPRPPLRRVR